MSKKSRGDQHRITRGVHDTGIDVLANTLLKEQKHPILSIIPNVSYMDRSVVPLIEGEIDLLVLYTGGSLGMYEVKSNLTIESYEKAQKQLQRMGRVFKHFNPELATYIAKEKVVIPYTPK